MSQKNNANINAKINQVLNQVDPNSIAPQELKELMQDMKDSYTNLLDHAKFFGLKEFDETLPYLAGQGVLHEGRLAAMKRQYQGVFDEAYLTYLTPVNPLYSLPEWNSLAKPVGAIVRYEGDAYRNTVANNTAIPTEEQSGWNAHNVAQGFFGEDFVQNQIYTPGNIVTATVDGRIVLIRFAGNEPKLITATAKNAWLAGDFEFFAELKPGEPEFLVADRTLNATDHGKHFFIDTEQNVKVVADDLPDSFSCKITSRKQTVDLDVISQNGTIVFPANKVATLVGFGTLNLVSLTQDIYQISGDLVNK